MKWCYDVCACGRGASFLLTCALSGQGDPVKAATLALLSGLVQMAVGMLKFGAVFDLVSPPVLAGFVSASAITIATGQLKDLLGLSGRGIGREFTHALSGVVENLEHTSVNDLLLGLGSMIMVYLLQQLKVRAELFALPPTVFVRVSTHGGVSQNRKGKNSWLASGLGTARNAVVVVLATVVALVAKVSMGDDDFNARHPFVLIGDMPAGLPEPAVPELDLSLLTSSCVLAIVGFLESFSIASSFGRKNGCVLGVGGERCSVQVLTLCVCGSVRLSVRCCSDTRWQPTKNCSPLVLQTASPPSSGPTPSPAASPGRQSTPPRVSAHHWLASLPASS